MVSKDTKKKHCGDCKHFREDKAYKCKAYYWTGIPSVHHPTAHMSYPDTFANAGCPEYYNIKREIYIRENR